ncbi:MAG TPA: glycosyltransferase family 4 protein [Anaerolineae bacterium]|nr:glycosyltransferase family 4 protein [Anaerolineae bacterium]
MKVLFLSWEYPPHLSGGLGQHVKDLVPALLEINPALELHVITPALGEETSHESLGRLHVHRVGALLPSDERIYDDVLAVNPAFVAVAQQLMKASGPFDLIHVHDWLLSFAAIELQEAFDLPLVATIHATERGRYRGALYSDMSRAIDAAESRLVQQARHVITCSVAMQHEVRDFYGVPVERISVIPNGIDGSRLRSLSTQDLSAFRRCYARPDERIVFNVGRMVYEKGADLLVETAPQVLSQAPDAKFVIGGRGPLFPSLRQRIDDLNLHEKVMLTGFLTDDERDQLYVVADVCVFPSRYEPFGIVALESMAAGTPVVVSDVGGLGTVVQHEQTGLTAYAEDVYSLARAIVRVLNDPQTASARAKLAQEYVEDCLAWPVIAGMTRDVYQAVLGTRNRLLVFE